MQYVCALAVIHVDRHTKSRSTFVVLSSAESAMKTLEKGPLSGWGHIVNVAEKHDCLGLSYHLASRHPSARGRKKFNPV